MRREGYYHVKRKHNQEWIVAQFCHNVADNEPGWLMPGSRLVSFGDIRWQEIDERRIERREWPSEEEAIMAVAKEQVGNPDVLTKVQYVKGFKDCYKWLKSKMQ